MAIHIRTLEGTGLPAGSANHNRDRNERSIYPVPGPDQPILIARPSNIEGLALPKSIGTDAPKPGREVSKLESKMFSFFRIPSCGFSRLGAPILLSVIFFFATQSTNAREVNSGAGTTQPGAAGQSMNTAPCYLGGSSQTPGESSDGSGYPGQPAGYSARPGAGADALQLDGDASQEYSSQDQGYAVGRQPQQVDGSPYDQAQQSQYPAGRSQFGYMPNQSSALAAQIIQILQQSPDLLSSFKDLAGQQYGVDPSTIPDSGVYNCIQEDSEFRSDVIAQLVQQGYAVNTLQGQPGTSRSAGEANDSPNNPNSPSSRYPGNAQAPPRSSEQPSLLLRETPDPYTNIPSLQNLYTQELPGNAKLRRFGSDAFEFGTGNANLLPMDLPVGPDYVLGPGDNLIINMWGGQSARLSRTVDRQGEIALPEAGTVTVSGLTIDQAQDAIQKALGTQFQGEHVELSLGRVRTIRIYVVGDVQRPGAYDVSSLSTVVNALYAAGGPTGRGSLRTLRQYRGDQLVQEIDLYDFLLHGVRSDVKRLMAGDTLLVPPVGPQVSVAGMVRRPAIYELKGNEDLKEVLDLAGGVLVSADLNEIRVLRVVAHKRITTLNVQIPVGADGTVQNMPSFQVQDDDHVQVSAILPYNEKVVYLEGHVFKPGPYAWREGMTVADLIHSYQDVMPEPADHAEVVHLVPPDLHPETTAFNLPDELIGNDPVVLQPFDTVRVFGRYQIDAPKVSIYGPVLRPGSYPMSEGMTVADLVRMAGGFRRSAYQKEADLSSYQVQNGAKVLLRRTAVNVGKALDGDKSADAVLKPGDVLGIRELAGWADIGSSISVSGEVTFAGNFGIEEGEHLSSVLKRAGGFRPDAYPEGAILERVQVRELEENNREEMIRRVEATLPTASQGVNGTSQDQVTMLQTMRQQQQDVLASLRSHPSSGRMVIKISSNISSWQHTSADVVVRAGDRLIVPKKPDFVLVSGQVYNPTGITFRPGKDASWYLRQAGGVTRSGDKKSIFILRADGSVVGSARGTIFDEGILGVKMHPGDSVIVPEKITSGSQAWRNVIGAAQIASSVALTGAVAGVF